MGENHIVHMGCREPRQQHVGFEGNILWKKSCLIVHEFFEILFAVGFLCKISQLKMVIVKYYFGYIIYKKLNFFSSRKMIKY